MYGVVGRYNEPPLPLAAFSVLCFSISAASSSSLIWPRRAWLWDPMSFSYSLRRSINRLRRSFLASSSASLMRNLLYMGEGRPHPIPTGHYGASTPIRNEPLGTLLPRA